MPQQSLMVGVPTTVVQNVIYAMPTSRVWVVSTAVLQFGNSVGGAFADVAASTTGMDSAYAFTKCTTGAPIVSLKKF